MARLILTVGTSGSGKSEWAANMANDLKYTHVVCRDDFRYSPAYDWGSYPGAIREMKINSYITYAVTNALKQGMNAIVTDTNLNLKALAHWSNVAKSFNTEIEIVLFTGLMRKLQEDPFLCMEIPEYKHMQCTRLTKMIQFLEENNIPHTYALGV